MENKNLGVIELLMFAALIASIYFVVDIIKLSDKRQEVENDKAMLGNIRYGLFSVYEWKDKVTIVLNKKIDEFELNDTNQGEINQKLEQMLYWCLDEVEKIMQDRATQGLFGALQSAVASFALDVNDLRRRVPDLANQAMLQLGDQGTMLNLKIFLKKKLSEYLESTIGKGDKSKYYEVLTKYKCATSNAVDCIYSLESIVKEYESSIWQKCIYLIISGVGCCLLLFFSLNKSKLQFYLTIGSCLVLLVAGIFTPMIDLDARIKQVKFLLMGENVTFDEQILFYQSKSIIDMFFVLFKNGQIESIIISILIVLFSVVFPTLKLLCSCLVVKDKSTSNNKIINFLVFKSAKWSMADVVVVAIFMSYIGFRGVINSQLAKLSTIHEHIEVITTNNTQLQAGFMVFTFFCLTSILFSSILSKFISNSN
jgi:Paraquat-inducible protein A